ncbi:MAG: O-antigen ligase family protein [Daejeonella sp.]
MYGSIFYPSLKPQNFLIILRNCIKTVRFAYDFVVPIIALGVFYLILFFNPYIYNAEQYSPYHYYYAILLSLGVLIGSVKCFFSADKLIKITIIDVFYSLFVLSVVISRYINLIGLNNEGVIHFLSLNLIYILIRIGISGKNQIIFIFFGILPSYCIENYIFLKQVFNFEPLNLLPLNLAATGTLRNSGIYSGYIIFVSTLFLGFINLVNNKLFKNAVILLIIINSVFVLAITESRSSIIAFMLFLIILLRNQYSTYFSYLNQKIKHNLFIRSFIIILLSILLIVLFEIKINSAFGRLLIWKICIKHWADNIIFGIGYGEFPSIYNLWQAEYFHSKSFNDFSAQLADVTNNCFNEPLQLIIENGLLGFISFGILISIVFKSNHSAKQIGQSLNAAIGCMLVFSLFSYPFHSMPCLLLFIILISISSFYCHKKTPLKIPLSLKKVLSFLIFIFSFFCLNYFINKSTAVKIWERANQMDIHDYKTLMLYRKAYPNLNENALFLYNYGIVSALLNSNNPNTGFLEESKRIYPKLDTYLYLGQIYTNSKNYKKAEDNFIFASYMVPSRFKPKYLLAKLYLTTKDTVAAKLVAAKIINMPIKIPSDEVENIRDEMRLLLIH